MSFSSILNREFCRGVNEITAQINQDNNVCREKKSWKTESYTNTRFYSEEGKERFSDCLWLELSSWLGHSLPVRPQQVYWPLWESVFFILKTGTTACGSKGGRREWDELGGWDGHIHTTLCKLIAHGKLLITQGVQLWALCWLRWVGLWGRAPGSRRGLEREGYMHTYSLFMLLYARN